jgi:hypothetical protein
MFFRSTLSLLVAFVAVACAEPFPTGSATVWELVNCWRNSDGHQSGEVWRWDPGNPPSTYNNPNFKATVFDGGPYYWQAKTTVWHDPKSNQFRNAYIMDGVSSTQNGPLGISTASNGDGTGYHGRLNSYHLCRECC